MGQGRSVLVVDDDPDIRDVIATALEDDGYSVDTASNGAEALDKAEHHQPDAVVLDATMPVMDGWEFLEHWQERPVERRAPVIVVSAYRASKAALRRGAKGYLSKPFDLDTLEHTLEIVL